MPFLRGWQVNARAAKVRRLLEQAREACGRDVGSGSYWAEMALTIGVLEHVHNLVTDEAGEHVTVSVPPMLGAFVLSESHHALHASMLEAVTAVRAQPEREALEAAAE